MELYEAKDYRNFLRAKLEGKGAKARFAKAVGCHPSFLSQVLGGGPDLSLEQAVAATEHLKLSGNDGDFFILLVQKSRAGSRALTEFFQRHIEQALLRRNRISSRVSVDSELTDRERITYYSSWTYAMIHILTSIQQDNQVEFIAAKTGLPEESVHRILEFLLSSKFVDLEKGRYRPSRRRVHIPADSDSVLQHHRNFRTRTLQVLEARRAENLHYSSVICLSKADAEKIRALLLRTIESAEKILGPSPEEQAYTFCLDYFPCS